MRVLPALRRVRQPPSKAELKREQWSVCREYVGAHPDLAERFPAERAVERARRTGGRVVDADSRSVALLRMRFVRTLEFAIAQVPDLTRPDVRVLDAGAADDIYLRALGKDGTALNVDEAAVGAMSADGVDAHVGSIYAMPFEDGAFDCALCLEVIEHLDDPIGALRELARVTSGALVVTIPYVGATRVRPYGYWAADSGASEEELQRRARDHHVFEFSLDDFERVVTHAGWRLSAGEPLIPFDPMPKWWLIALEKEAAER